MNGTSRQGKRAITKKRSNWRMQLMVNGLTITDGWYHFKHKRRIKEYSEETI
jgi:hypothetical protein